MTSISARGAIAALGFLICAPALAQTPAPASKPDPNQEVICEKQEVIGSRLQTKRVCRTRAEWADARREDQQYLERVQSQRGLKGE
jgi:hypothetical protein